MIRNNTEYTYGRIWKIAYPVLVSLVMEQLIGMTDTAFLGRVSEVALGASAIAGIYYMVIFMLGLGFSIGMQIIIGRRNGEGDHANAGKVFWHGLYFLILLALVITFVSELLSPGIMAGMVSSPQVLSASLSYVRWRIMGLVFGFTTASFRAFYIGTTQTKVLTANSLCMVISNILFNGILVFGKFGLPAMGITGAAIGSTMAEFVSLAFFVIYTRRRCDTEKFSLDRPARFEWSVMKSIMSVSVWTMIQNFFSISTWFIFFLFIEHTGERALAVSNIIRSVSGLIFMFLMAFASTGSTLVSNTIGDGREEDVMPLVGRMLRFSYMVIVPVLILCNCFPELIIRIYTNIPDLVRASVPSLRVLSVCYLVSIPAFVSFQAVGGTGNTRAAFILELSALVVYAVYCFIVIEVMRSDVAVCWTAEAVYAVIMVMTCGLYLKSGKWKGRTV